MVREKFAVRLTSEERDQLEHMIRAGKSPARSVTRARILLKTGEGWPAPKVAQALECPLARCSTSSGASPRGDWRGRCGTGSRPAGTGSWMSVRRPI